MKTSPRKSSSPTKQSPRKQSQPAKEPKLAIDSDDETTVDNEQAMLYPEVKLQENDDATVVSDTNNNDDDDDLEDELDDDELEHSSQHSIEVTPDIITRDNNDVDGNATTAQQLLSSLASLMAMAPANQAGGGGGGRKGASKLDKITERLTQRQLAGEQSLLHAFSPSSGQHSESNGTSGSNGDEDDEDDEAFAAEFGTGDEKYKCPLCQLKLDSQHMFTLHIRSHNPSDHSNTCQLCHKTLSSASSLDRHMLIHSGERPFKCSICNMAFTTNGNMHRHMRTHGHGSIGYTPRGAKRRAKLFAQQAAKVYAAAEAGEHVDASTLSKLKKAAIEVTSGNGKSPISSEIKKLCRGRRGSESFDDNVPINPIQMVYETKSIADAAAAFASAITQSDSKKKPANIASSSSGSGGSAGLPSPPFGTFPLPSHHHNHHHQDSSITSLTDLPSKPAKSKPGRKRKNGGAKSMDNSPLPAQINALQNAAMAALNQGLAGPDPIQCPICSSMMNSKMDLHAHMMAFHASDKLFCIDCGMILDNYDVYVAHACTFSAPTVMAALQQNPSMSQEALFPSTNTNRMNFSNLATMAGAKATPKARGGNKNILQQNSPIFNNNNNNNSTSDLSALIATLQKQLQAQQNGLAMVSPAAHLPKDSPLMDLSKKAPASTGMPAQCNTCSQRFTNTRDLKRHFETFCHECNLDCGSSSVYEQHREHSHPGAGSNKFPTLSKALTGAQALAQQQAQQAQQQAQQLMANLFASNGFLNQMAPSVVSSTSLASPLGKASAPNPLALAASLASMQANNSTGNEMLDLADIQSIISNANKGQASAFSSSLGPDPISPNRASDADNLSKVLKNGDASHHHPDSPASADSAGMALGQSGSGSTGNGTDSGHESANTNEFACSKDDVCSYDEDDEPAVKRTKKSGQDSAEDESLDLSVDGQGGATFRCEDCKLSFRSLNALKRHNRGHTAGGGHSHACRLCPYKSLDKSTLIRHLRTHNGERPFQCSICKYAFTTKANCERHVKKRHKDLDANEIRQAMQFNEDMAATVAATRVVAEKIFIKRDELPTSQDTVCKQCQVDHGTNKELRAHLRVPNNPCSAELKPFVCTVCGTGFNTRNNCVRHILKQHPETIQVSDEEAAKVVAAIANNGQTDTTAESLLRDDSSFSGSPARDRSFNSNSVSCSSDEGEEYDEGIPPPEEKMSPPSPNASLDALFRVKFDKKVHPSPLLATGNGPLNLSVSAGGKKSPLDLSSKPDLSSAAPAIAAAISAAQAAQQPATQQPNFGAFFGATAQDLFAQNGRDAMASLLALQAENEQKQVQQQQLALAAAAAGHFGGGLDMSAFAKSFSPATAGLFGQFGQSMPTQNYNSSNDLTSLLMAQFHAQQQQQISLKAALAKHH